MTHPRPAFNHRNLHARPPRRSAGPQPAADADSACAQLFQGMQFDPAASPPDFAARAPSPTPARWMDPEPPPPLAYVDGLNVYTACADNPIQPRTTCCPPLFNL